MESSSGHDEYNQDKDDLNNSEDALQGTESEPEARVIQLYFSRLMINVINNRNQIFLCKNIFPLIPLVFWKISGVGINIKLIMLKNCACEISHCDALQFILSVVRSFN